MEAICLLMVVVLENVELVVEEDLDVMQINLVVVEVGILMEEMEELMVAVEEVDTVHMEDLDVMAVMEELMVEEVEELNAEEKAEQEMEEMEELMEEVEEAVVDCIHMNTRILVMVEMVVLMEVEEEMPVYIGMIFISLMELLLKMVPIHLLGLMYFMMAILTSEEQVKLEVRYQCHN
mgnify:FL=1